MLSLPRLLVTPFPLVCNKPQLHPFPITTPIPLHLPFIFFSELGFRDPISFQGSLICLLTLVWTLLHTPSHSYFMQRLFMLTSFHSLFMISIILSPSSQFFFVHYLFVTTTLSVVFPTNWFSLVLYLFYFIYARNPTFFYF